MRFQDEGLWDKEQQNEERQDKEMRDDTAVRDTEAQDAESAWEHKRHRHGGRLCREPEDLLDYMRACGHVVYHMHGKSGGQSRILSILSQKEAMTQKELQGILRIQPGSMSEIISKMECKGLVLREKDSADQRRILLKLSERGRQEAAFLNENYSQKDLFGCLSAEEQEQLKGLLGKLLADWKTL